jgi:hypothetical protein
MEIDDLNIRILAKDIMERNFQDLDSSLYLANKNFEIVGPGSDISQTINLAKDKNVDFILVKKKKNIVGIITKEIIEDLEPLLH